MFNRMLGCLTCTVYQLSVNVSALPINYLSRYCVSKKGKQTQTNSVFRYFFCFFRCQPVLVIHFLVVVVKNKCKCLMLVLPDVMRKKGGDGEEAKRKYLLSLIVTKGHTVCLSFRFIAFSWRRIAVS